jgi:hypothetical protein
VPRKGDKLMSYNRFKLSTNNPRWREADAELKTACGAAVKKLGAIRYKYLDCETPESYREFADLIFQIYDGEPEPSR